MRSESDNVQSNSLLHASRNVLRRRKMGHPPGTVTPAEAQKMRFSSPYSAPPLRREFSGPDTV